MFFITQQYEYFCIGGIFLGVALYDMQPAKIKQARKALKALRAPNSARD